MKTPARERTSSTTSSNEIRARERTVSRSELATHGSGLPSTSAACASTLHAQEMTHKVVARITLSSSIDLSIHQCG